MRVTFKQVHPEDFDAQDLMALAREGKLYVKQNVVEMSVEDIKNNVRAYVSSIHPLATAAFRKNIEALWDDILDDDFYDSFFIPDARVRKCREMNKYGVMRIVGVLRSLKVYDNVNDSRLCAMLEHQEGDSSYRAYLGKGVDDDVRKELKKLTGIFKSDSF